MRLLIPLLFAAFLLPAQTADERDAVAAVQRLFDAMTARDAAAIRASMIADARLYSVRDSGAPATFTAADLANNIAASKVPVLERFTAAPRVLVRNNMAQVWGEYEFLRDGKLNHCGVDSASLFKTADGWKIASISFTTETTGCAPGK
ncbi:MAG TPA: hypothetical protein VN736_23370 [Candidatus Limnocylindrales bacterium]|nr:hypothetical protein [Candidatus Limnocylindrales bacterium]